MAQTTNLIADAVPATASTTTVGTTTVGIPTNALAVSVIATLPSLTGGTLDYYIQTKIDANTWVDWMHFTQVAGGASTVVKVAHVTKHTSTAEATAGTGTDTTATPALAAGTNTGGAWGSSFRAVYVSGSGTSVGVTPKIYFAFFRSE
jgi:hypothetical protein